MIYHSIIFYTYIFNLLVQIVVVMFFADSDSDLILEEVCIMFMGFQ